jgi:hypothetical protein
MVDVIHASRTCVAVHREDIAAVHQYMRRMEGAHIIIYCLSYTQQHEQIVAVPTQV